MQYFGRYSMKASIALDAVKLSFHLMQWEFQQGLTSVS